VLNSKELFINIDKKLIPRWNPAKHFYEQSSEVIAFWQEEFKKISFGVNIGGYFFHPWLYFHINFFKTPIPVLEKGRKKPVERTMTPPLDDLFLLIVDSYQEAEDLDRGLFLFGTRGSTKSTILASYSHWTLLTKNDGVHSIMGGSDPDLKNIIRLLQHSFNNIAPALNLPKLRGEWDSEVTFGIKQKAGDDLVHSSLSVVNANSSRKSSSEKGAGLSPVGYIFDEVGKHNFWKSYESALPSFRTQYGYKLVPICCGTGGNAELSIDAQKVMEDPEGHEMLLCNWDRLERGVPEEYITWTEGKKQKFATFIPGQMSYRLDVPKKEVKFTKFLGINCAALNYLHISVTDWPKATKRVKELTSEAIKDEDSRNRNRMYYPQDISDCFLTDSENPFPKKMIERHIRKLKEEGNVGKNIELYKQDGKQKFEFSNKTRSKIRHTGGVSDAPIVAHMDPPEELPPDHIYVAGLDGYKIDVSQTDSLGSMYLLRRRNLELGSPCETIAASYSARPDKMRYFNTNCEKILKAWNATCLIEAVDMGFQQYLENKGEAQDLLARSFTLSGNKGANSKLKTTYGVYPTVGNQEYMFNLVVEFTKEEHVMGIDEEGNQIIKTGVEFINDIELLQEMLFYYKGGNFDRIDAFKHALTHARELDKKGYVPKQEKGSRSKINSLVKQSIDEKLRSSKYGNSSLRGRMNKY